MLCPFAEKRLSKKQGPAFKGGPFKIVWHTTEGSTIEGAIETLEHNGYEPHFAIGRDKHGQVRIVQMLDTSRGARALANKAGGVETNLDGAIQIELVGFADKPKDRDTLLAGAKVARWIESVHGVPNVWPAGNPPGKEGPFPRDKTIWNDKGGHFGHSQVPENTHYDPGKLSEQELSTLMGEDVWHTDPVPPPEPTGDQDVYQLQTVLKASGFDPKGLDGDWGKNTRAAFIASVPTPDASEADVDKWLAVLRKAVAT